MKLFEYAGNMWYINNRNNKHCCLYMNGRNEYDFYCSQYPDVEGVSNVRYL